MADKSKYEELVAEKIRAGLSRDDAEAVAKQQIAWDATDPHDDPPKKRGKPSPAQTSEKGESK
jgi:hypothetical protein